jgi:hypothetical protein
MEISIFSFLRITLYERAAFPIQQAQKTLHFRNVYEGKTLSFVLIRDATSLKELFPPPH